ncbi:hypothetical protein JX580_09215 [Thiomicrospira microaerophila]|uniref:hypothetical protein n=1 Tax=Thiomicrospira microaerophila TaxID=406020 RepID=UPI00200E2E67|nr:hypothetical protein [Thiomicrospira microaerophila]UQB41839.1 hypothetical protein JX580_09215 [Thiomicrospira microaerophila]
MRKVTAVMVLTGLLSWGAMANEVTYREHIKPLWQSQCMACHGANAPYLGEFDENENKYVKLNLGPRMDSYADLLMFVAWPDTGALMRRLDDRQYTQDGKPGNMYVYLGETEQQRQQNLALFKAWVGDQAWTLKRKNDITKEELTAIKAGY